MNINEISHPLAALDQLRALIVEDQIEAWAVVIVPREGTDHVQPLGYAANTAVGYQRLYTYLAMLNEQLLRELSAQLRLSAEEVRRAVTKQ